jgi:phosphatidylglycerol---prolipoprotein diacylglyceryl transferase
MQPELHIFGITLQTFGLMMGIGFVVAGAAAGQFLKEIGKPVDWAYEFIFAAIVGGLVGSRLWWVVENWDETSDDLFGSLFTGAGLVFYGGAIGGAIAVLFWSWRKGWLEARTFDMGAAPLAAGYAIGRIGCQLAGDGDYGIPWDGPWAMAYPNGTVPTTDEVHPTPVYEAITMLLVAAVLWRFRHRWQPGTLFAIYLILSGAERFLVEFVRRNEDVFLGLTQPQLFSVVLMAGGGISLWLLSRRAPSPAPARAARQRA